MLSFRLPFAVFTAWLFVLFNVERLLAPINIASFVYVLAAMMGLALLLWPRLLEVSPVFLGVLSLPVLLVMKYALDYPIAGAALAITITELCALAVTLLLARWVASTFEELRTAVFGNLLSDLSSRAHAFESGQGELYREVRRARSFERPLAFLAVAPTTRSISAAKDRFTEEVMLRMQRQYVNARVADLLSRRLKDCDIIAQRNGHFVAALPETDRDMARKVSRQLQTEALKDLGIELSVGVCTCPEEEATFVGLLKRAEEEMWRGGESTLVGSSLPIESGHLVDVQSLLNGSHEVREENDPLLASGSTAP